MALSQCLSCKYLTLLTDVSGKFLYKCGRGKVINKPELCPFWDLKT